MRRHLVELVKWNVESNFSSSANVLHFLFCDTLVCNNECYCIEMTTGSLCDLYMLCRRYDYVSAFCAGRIAS